jgi:Cu(I)/Ag(I) efflux system membrane protein CusA/SilA
VGWIFEYGLVTDSTHSVDNRQLRQLQDWTIKPALQTVPGVAEVASVGGQVRQFQVTVNPVALRGYGLTLGDIEAALRAASADAGGEAIETAETEWMIRTRGLVTNLEDLRDLPVTPNAGAMGAVAPQGADPAGMPSMAPSSPSVAGVDPTRLRTIRLSEVATLSEGPAMRRGVTDLNGEGDVVAGVVVMRYGQNALATIEAVKAKLETLEPSLPAGVRIVPLYDRSTLITKAVSHLGWKILEEMLIVALVCAVFLFHARSALVAVFTLPVALLAAFLVMRLQGIGADIMSLGGLAIAIGAMVDAAIWSTNKNCPKPNSARVPQWCSRHAARWGPRCSGLCF